MEAEAGSMLRVCELTKRFDPRAEPVVNRVGFEVEPGEIFALLGPSGCGKSTTLRCIAGLERPDHGTIEVDGRTLDTPRTHVPTERRQVGLVFQDYAVFPHLTVLGNVAFGLCRYPRRERRQRAMELLTRLRLADLADRRPHELSGGQLQRVVLARSLAPRPRLLLLDEPFSSLDAQLRVAMRQEIRALLKAWSVTALLVTHDQEEALSFADRLAVMVAGQIAQRGAPEEVYARPATEFVAQFLGRTNLLHGLAEGEQATTSLGEANLDRPAHGPVLLSLRPEHIGLAAPGGGPLDAEVLSREFRGHDLSYRVTNDGVEYLIHTDYRSSWQPGDRVSLLPREPAVVLRDAEKSTAPPSEWLAHDRSGNRA